MDCKDTHGFKDIAVFVEIIANNLVFDTFAGNCGITRCYALLFSYEIDGRFTGLDLVKETITIRIQRRLRQDTGRILLDGATQIELIR